MVAVMRACCVLEMETMVVRGAWCRRQGGGSSVERAAPGAGGEGLRKAHAPRLPRQGLKVLGARAQSAGLVGRSMPRTAMMFASGVLNCCDTTVCPVSTARARPAGPAALVAAPSSSPARRPALCLREGCTSLPAVPAASYVRLSSGKCAGSRLNHCCPPRSKT
jgi:hypothetical protein